MTLHYFKFAIVGILGGLMKILAGLDMYWQGVLAILGGLTALGLGIRNVASPDSQPDTPGDFPLPDPMPGLSCEPPPIDGVNEAALEKEEVAFAVIVPKASADESALKALGHRLQTWKVQNALVRQIIGLEQLLEGKFPETSRAYLHLPVMLGAGPCVEKVALVFVAPAANTRRTGKTLRKHLAKYAIEEVVSPWCYGSANR